MNQVLAEKAPVIKQIIWPTDINGKMSNPGFIHIDVAPTYNISESTLNNTIFKISTADNSHAPITASIIDIMRMKFGELPAAFMWASHGIMGEQFIKYFQSKYSSIKEATPMAVYFYLKVNLQ